MSTRLSESAAVQGSLWGRRARDWADLQEAGVAPAYKRVFQRLDLAPGCRLLDAGCGAGLAAQYASEAGLQVSGIDAAEPFLQIARERSPHGDFRLGELLSLPWPDGSFDAVIGFNSVQYAVDPVAALREAKRVVKPGGKVGIIVWGSIDECEAVAHFKALGSLMPAPPPGAPAPPAPLALEQRIAELAAEAGLKVKTDERVDCPWLYPDMATAIRALKSAGPTARVIDHAGEQAVDEALTTCLTNFRQSDGMILFRNKFRALTASN